MCTKIKLNIGFIRFFLCSVIAAGYITADWSRTIPFTGGTIPFLSKTQVPKIDGVINEKEWDATHRAEGLFINAVRLENRKAVYWIVSDGEKVFIGIKTETPPVEGDELLARVQADPEKDQIVAFHDDCIEIWIDPHRRNRKRGEGDGRFFQMLVNAHGALFDQAFDKANKTKPADRSWRVEWEYANSIKDGFWHIEIAIPLGVIGAEKSDFNEPWGFRVVRNWKRPNQQSDCAPFVGGFDDPDTMFLLHFKKETPFVRLLQLQNKDTRNPEILLELCNPSKKPSSISLDLLLQASDNPYQIKKETVVLSAGERKTVVLGDIMKTGLSRAILSATDPSGKTIYFARKFEWDLVTPANTWRVVSGTASAVGFDIAYYPTPNVLHTRLDVSGVADKAEITGAVLSITGKGIEKPLTFPFPPFSGDVAKMIVTLPKLSGGNYEAEACFSGVDKVKNLSFKKVFERKYFPWENNQLGLGNEVIPPFTPLVQKGTQVSCVLRTHEIDPSGMWKQVTSLGKPVQSAPMTFIVQIDGKKYDFSVAEPLKYQSIAGHEIKAKSVCQAGPLKVTFEYIWDYDGMMKVYMHWDMSSGQKLEMFDMQIPIRSDIAKLMHVGLDFFRGNYAGYLKPDQGLIYESKQESRMAQPGTYLPYMWIGNERQGICWFTDNDRDWLVDDKTSVQKVYREKDSVKLQISFITAPAALTRRHTIVFGLQATPTKPMPEKPMNWRKIVYTSRKDLSDLFRMRLVGSYIYWSYPVGSLYPLNEDYSLFKLIKEGFNGTYEASKWKTWKEGFPTNDSWHWRYIRGMTATEQMAKVEKPDIIIPYTDARGALQREDAWNVFQDEWYNVDFSSRAWSGEPDETLMYEIMPVRSRQDYYAWYMQKLFDTKIVGGIYFDCTYVKPNKDVVVGGAFYDDKGNLRQSSDLFAMRDLMKRIAVLAYRNTGYNLNISHMTSAQIIPINTWAGINLDWEWKYGLDDFQERFTRDYIRTSTIGLQSGCMPLVLGSIGFQGAPEKVSAARPWLLRNLAGVMLVHEIKDWGNPQDVHLLLYQFGYGNKDCAVYNYWDDNYPLTVKGSDTASIVFERDGELLIVITSYEPNDSTIEVSFNPAVVKVKKQGSFFNAEKKEPVTSTGKNSCKTDLKNHDYIVLHYR